MNRRVPDEGVAAALPWTSPVRRAHVTTLQLNIGRYCNLACTHCHIEASPRRSERMSPEVLGRVLQWIAEHRPATLDLTGGAPELLPGFRELVVAGRAAGCEVIDRCNLVVLEEDGQEDLATFLAAHAVHVVASLPCYLQANVDGQRGRGSFDASVRGLRRLNEVGYGVPGGLPLHLVYNPTGAGLPPEQAGLEVSYRERLSQDWGIHFTGLWCLANVPIRRFRKQLERDGQLEAYEGLLQAAYNPATLDSLMCRSTLSVDHEGRLFDCDFHLALDLPLGGTAERPSLFDLDPTSLLGQIVPMGRHCLACTAGAGSSCTGAVV